MPLWSARPMRRRAQLEPLTTGAWLEEGAGAALGGATLDEPPEAPDTELPELPELPACPPETVEVEPGVVEWPGKARLTYIARAATAATEATPIILLIDRERSMAASRCSLAAPRGSTERRPMPGSVWLLVITTKVKEAS
jgi:hypothetical protein